jgi:hypothetical protein
VGSNPTLSAERCWSGLTGTPGERVSGFPTVGSNPTLSAIDSTNQQDDLKPDSFNLDIYIWGSLPCLMLNGNTRIIPLS